MARAWPTDLDADGSAPTSIMMVGSGDEHLMRQAMYQLQAAMQLEERGYKVDSFQVPLAGKMIRITLPVVANTPDGGAVIIYTQCEEWTRERISDLEAWMAHVREESDAAVLVASRLRTAGCRDSRRDRVGSSPVRHAESTRRAGAGTR